MSLRFKCALAVACAITVVSMQSSAQAACSHQSAFSGEVDACLDNASPPPPLVIQAILATKEAEETFEDLGATERKDIAKLFKGLTVHLRSEAQDDMIVRGGFPMSGGDNTWFWIVTSTRKHPIALWVQGNAVTVLPTRHNGYADLRTDWAAGSHSATRIFRYTGRSYKLFHEDYQDPPPS